MSLRSTARFAALHADGFPLPARVLAPAEQPTAIRGIGRYTVLLPIFNLGRPDLLPVDDTGFGDSYRALYALGEADEERQPGMGVPGCQRTQLMWCDAYTPPLVQRSGRLVQLSRRRGRRAPRQRE